MDALVSCSSCRRPVSEKIAIKAEVLPSTHAISSPAPIYQYSCPLCVQLEALNHPPLVIHHPRFKQGYEAGKIEAAKWPLIEDLMDTELVMMLKRLFATYAAEGDEEMLVYGIGSIARLLIDITTLPVIDAYQSIL